VSPSGPEAGGVRGPCRTVAVLVCAARQLLRSAAWQNPARQQEARLRRSGGSGPRPLDPAARFAFLCNQPPLGRATAAVNQKRSPNIETRGMAGELWQVPGLRCSTASQTSPVHHSLGRFLSEQPLRRRDWPAFAAARCGNRVFLDTVRQGPCMARLEFSCTSSVSRTGSLSSAFCRCCASCRRSWHVLPTTPGRGGPAHGAAAQNGRLPDCANLVHSTDGPICRMACENGARPRGSELRKGAWRRSRFAPGPRPEIPGRQLASIVPLEAHKKTRSETGRGCGKAAWQSVRSFGRIGCCSPLFASAYRRS
jgi:hypothetical protein